MAVVGRRPRRLLVVGLAVLRRPGLTAVRHGHRRPAHAGGALVPRRPPQLRRTGPRHHRNRRRRRGPLADPRARASSPGTSCATRSPAAGPASPAWAWRPGDRVVGLRAQRARGGDRLPGHGQPRRGLGLVPTRVRFAQRHRPLRPARPRSCCWSRGATATGPRTSTATTRSTPSSPACPRCAPSSTSTPAGTNCSPRPAHSPSSRCPSTTRSTSCSPPGTTGPPKAIVHGHGGILLEHLKTLGLHQDLGPDDRFFWFTTTGWMMWNFLVSGLCLGSTIVLFDGDPGWPDLGTLWRMAAETGVTVFGVGAPFLLSCRAAGLGLDGLADLSSIRSVGSTGAPLPAEGFEWVYDQLPGVWLTSISGGTDVCTAFVGGNPLVPVVAGEISCRELGARVAAFDDAGRPGRRPAGRAGGHRPHAEHAAALLGRRRRPALPRRLLLPVPGRVVPRRLDHHHRARLVHHHRPVRRHPQPGRGAAGHERVLRRRRGRARGARQPGDPPRGRRRRARAACCCSSSSNPAATSTTTWSPGSAPTCARRSPPATCPTRSSRCRPSPAPTRARSSRSRSNGSCSAPPADEVVSLGSLADPSALDAFVERAARPA